MNERRHPTPLPGDHFEAWRRGPRPLIFPAARFKLGGTSVARMAAVLTVAPEESLVMSKSILSSAAIVLGIALPATAAAQAAPASPCPRQLVLYRFPPAGGPRGPARPVARALARSGRTAAAPSPRRPRRPLAGAAPTRRTPYPPPPPPPPGSPPIVVYQPPPPALLGRPEEPPPYELGRPPRPLNTPRQSGVSAHFEGAAMGSGADSRAGMGGLGLAMRYRPTPHLALESGFDFVGGHGYAGDTRNETAFTVNGLLFLNPRSRWQFYLLAGLGWSWAHSVCDSPGASCAGNNFTGPVDSHYSYFGAQAGGGLEYRLSRAIALNVDMRFFVRGRTDGSSQSKPEFTNAEGQSTNTSGGVLFTAGGTLYF